MLKRRSLWPEIIAATVFAIAIASALASPWGMIPLGALICYWTGVARGKGIKLAEFTGIKIYDPNTCKWCDKVFKGTAMVEHYLAAHPPKEDA